MIQQKRSKSTRTCASPVLSAAFNSPCIEGQTKTYNLISTSPSAFRLLVEFMYRDSLDSLITSYDVRRQLSNILDPNRYSSEALKEIEAELKVDVKLLIEVWYLGDYFIMPNLQDWALMHLEIARTNYKHCLPWKMCGKLRMGTQQACCGNGHLQILW
ncbi:hypothetical protein L207DRAFT_25448 [Hyaloscypha variabilis F]|uniref:BTB domain-containing protein n=1 Tax=Hyaloscypha variabilis (strain UAMH 11265 / GT02V1 / F) TaxID=1149755 RepID=A0A2J6RMG3_HYAVF|nr:hypothetical protein L207DRAFT_25448 [Hyaloscypha variabilis F]